MDDEPESVALVSPLKERAQQCGPYNSYKRFDSSFVGRSHNRISAGDTDIWEAWALSTTGEFRSRPLVSDDGEDAQEVFEDDLFVASPGPITRLGKCSIAVGFGNTVKLVTLGKESFDGLTNIENDAIDIGLGSYKWRTRKGAGRKVQ